MNFKQLRDANIARDAEWARKQSGEPVELSLAFRGTELAGELGELLNQIKKLERKALGLKGSPPNIENLLQEFGDVQICLDLLAMKCSKELGLTVDLGECARESFNNKSEQMGFLTRV